MGCCKIDQSRRSLNVERLGDRQESLGIIRHAISCTKLLARWPERVGRAPVQCVRQDERGPAASHSSASPQRSNPTSVSGRAQQISTFPSAGGSSGSGSYRTHPPIEWVRTDMGGLDALLGVEDSVPGIAA